MVTHYAERRHTQRNQYHIPVKLTVYSDYINQFPIDFDKTELHLVPIQCSETPRTSQQYGIEVFKEEIGDASLSDNGRHFFSNMAS